MCKLTQPARVPSFDCASSLHVDQHPSAVDLLPVCVLVGGWGRGAGRGKTEGETEYDHVNVAKETNSAFMILTRSRRGRDGCSLGKSRRIMGVDFHPPDE